MIAKLITGSGKSRLGQLDLLVGVEQEVAGHHVLQLRDRADVALAELVGGLVLLALEREQRADPLLAVRARVDERRVGGDRALEHAEDVDPARERVGDRLEDERRAVAPSTSIGEPFFAGDGTPSTSRSSTAVVPRFFVATPHATGKSSPRVTALLSAYATSSGVSSCPSR